jgi:hypothetical protein
MPSVSQVNELYGARTKDIHDAFNAFKGGYTNSVIGLANQGLVLQIASAVDIRHPISFVAFMDSYSDSFSQNFQQDQVFGRMDPIQSYQNTQRKLSLSWKLLAANEQEAETNMFNINRLTTLMYPDYTTGTNKHIQRAPVMAIKYMNLVRDPEENNGNFLLGTIGSLSITPDLEFGVIQPMLTAAVPTPQGGSVGTIGIPGEILPKIFTLSIDYNPIHIGTLGKAEMGNNHLYDVEGAKGGFNRNEEGVPQDPLQSDKAASDEHYNYYKSQIDAITSAQNDEKARTERPWERVSQQYKQAYENISKNFKE